jgi:ATP-dependent Lon protease
MEPVSVSAPASDLPPRVRVKNVQLSNYTDDEKFYYKKLKTSDQTKIAEIESRMQEINSTAVPLRFKIITSNVEESIKAIAMQKLDQIYSLEPSSDEYHKILHWIESVVSIPFGIYKTLPVDKESKVDDIKTFIKSIKHTMDHEVYGHTDAKDQIIRLLAQWISNPQSKGLVIGIQGAMGTGKTTLVKDAICKVLGLPFAFVPLGGVSDSAYLVGHSYTYVGSTWGRIVDVLIKSKCMNPVVFFDELDKVSSTSRGDDIINILIHLTDSTQNDKFNDKYFTGIEFDLSRSLVIFSYNDEDKINPILRDRMVRIRTDGYKSKDKIAICQQYMIPSINAEFGLAGQDKVVFSDEIIHQIISKIEKEQGVRNLKRALYDVVSNINLMKILDGADATGSDCKVTEKQVAKFISAPTKNDDVSRMMYV